MTVPALPPADDRATPSPGPSWRGELALSFGARAGTSALVRRRHLGPLAVQQPLFPEGPAVCHVYLLHPPGGLVSGDDLHIQVDVEPGAHALLTTPASTKVYRRRPGAGPARQVQQLHVAAGARLEWLPQDTIVFQDAAVELGTRVELSGDAGFVGWEIVCLGRPAAGDRFIRGHCRQRFEVFRDGQPLVIERTRIDGGAEMARAPWGLGGAAVVGTMIASPVPEDAVEIARAAMPEPDTAPPGERATATLLAGALVCRYLGDSTAAARALFERVWAGLRPAVVGRTPCPPRIWLT